MINTGLIEEMDGRQYECMVYEMELLHKQYDALKKAYDKLVTLIDIAKTVADLEVPS